MFPCRFPRQISPMSRLFLLLGLSFALAGCVVGGRHQRVHSTPTMHGQQGEIQGTASAIEFGIVADFRYFRLALPFEGAVTELTGSAKPTGHFSNKANREFRALRLDIPLLSLYNFKGGGRWQYPGTMHHRHSLEIWTGAAAALTAHPDWWADIGITYYQHNAFAVRLYGGYGQLPYREMMEGRNLANQFSAKPWEGYAGGLALGLEITLFAGEHALDLLKFIFEEDQRVRDSLPAP